LKSKVRIRSYIRKWMLRKCVRFSASMSWVGKSKLILF